ncbi:Endonuclease YncB, thermonuclease family [Mesorhizobium albiziae]|uniref:Endonuclease YncB, thermonuclease family n=2 Tax=Neomesorhizobium albiziae TaxID=335020 RepID=A0A1I4E2X5_9HYPH|nr:Endonuclease YncB, thermonuclease family [Mesorhizobium albiziae]
MVLLVVALPSAGAAADMMQQRDSKATPSPRSDPGAALSAISGHPSVIDGRTLWFSEQARSVRLAGIDACAVPQWSYDPTRHGKTTMPKPVPCGPLAKAWLKRSLGNNRVTCTISASAEASALVGRCVAKGRDLAIDMLRVGWARTTTASPQAYLVWQDRAKSARHGMWATYVLDMDEWRRKAIDRTLSRKPIADFNLLAERESEISPPFADARNRPRHVDR